MIPEKQIEEYQDESELVSEEELCRQHQEKLMALADTVLLKRSEAVQYRETSGIERKWHADEVIFDGLDGSNSGGSMLDYATGEAYKNKGATSSRSSVVINIIRGRCETAEGRFSDILLPVDDKNWGLKVTPVPELNDQMQDERPALQNGQAVTDQQGKQSTMADVARDKKNKAKKSMKLMETEIDDQLTECDFNGEQRKLIRSAIRLGTGIIKGPNTVKSVENKWNQVNNNETGAVAYLLEKAESMQPGSSSVNPWNVYPSPSAKENIQKTAEYIWEKDEILPRDVRGLVGVDGYDEYQLKEVLRELPLRTRASSDNRNGSTNISNIDTVRLGNSYEKWEFHGDLDASSLESIGFDCEEVQTSTVSVCIVFINDRPVKIVQNTSDIGELPYDFFQWTVVSSDSPWGIGIPRMMMWLQRVITAAWRKMMDNAGDASGQNIIIGKGVEPADGVWELGGEKLWIATGDIEDARKAFAQFQVKSIQKDLQAIIELALRFVDLETSMPTIFQGEAQEAPETLGATNIMVDSSNIGVRQRVKLYDDRVTRPHLTRYYNHNMQYNEKQEIKGDFSVDPRGTSVLLERDQQAQTIMQIFSLKQDPDVNRITNWEKAGKQLYASKKLDILKTEDELAEYDKKMQEQQNAPKNPTVEAAEIRTSGDLEKEKLRQQSDMTELEYKAAEAQREREHDKTMKQMDLEIKMMEYSEKRGIELDKLKVQLSLGSAGMNLQKELSTDKAPKSVPEVSTPPTEPAGRAPVGQAYQR